MHILTCIACLDKSTAGIFCTVRAARGTLHGGQEVSPPANARTSPSLRGVASVKRCPCRLRLRQRYGLEKAAPRA